MVAEIQPDAHNLARPANRRPQPHRSSNAQCGSALPRHPVPKFSQSIIRKKFLVIVQTKSGNIQPRSILKQPARLFPPHLAESNQFHAVAPHATEKSTNDVAANAISCQDVKDYPTY